MLDTYFKRYFWTFTLLSLVASAFLFARTVNALLAQVITASAADLAMAQPGGLRRSATERARIPISAFLERNLFRAEREAPTPLPVDVTTTSGNFEPHDCSASGLGARLLATFLDAGNPDASMAVFVDTTPDQRPFGARIGERLLDQAVVKIIDWREVYVDNGGKCERFSLEEQAEAARTESARSSDPPQGDAADKLGDGIQKVSDREYTIPRQQIDNVLSNLPQVAGLARIVPSFSDGKANGFKLFSIRPNSLYAKIGIQNGDVVQRINGLEINSPDRALEVYSKLKDAQSITVDLVRGGMQQTLSYSIR
ncbi:MAG: hypothetical protein KC933_22475 [Myxococcales bacterium]|nr:hypothetical protein [Myxococcales bacterium]